MTAIAGMDFGFPVVAHPTRADTAYLLPLESDGYRCTPDGHCTVWRTTDAGASWEPLTAGLPQHDAHLTVLRDAFTTDGARSGRSLLRDPHGRGVRLARTTATRGGSWPSTCRRCCRSAPRPSADADGERWRSAVRVPTPLRELVAGASSVAVDVAGRGDGPAARRGGVTVGSVLDALAAEHPALERRVRDEQGQARVHVNLFVGADNIRDLDGLDDGDSRRARSCRSSPPSRAASRTSSSAARS